MITKKLCEPVAGRGKLFVAVKTMSSARKIGYGHQSFPIVCREIPNLPSRAIIRLQRFVFASGESLKKVLSVACAGTENEFRSVLFNQRSEP